MSVLESIPNIKVPYASEGVIRTAQLDDTVAPENSVQLAVNMNFDRVGAIQTRPGVGSYADDLVEYIKNYGTLRNNIVPPGYAFIGQLGQTEEIDTTGNFRDPAAVKISDTKVAIFWTGVDGDGFCQNLLIGEQFGLITPIGTPLEFDTSSNAANAAILTTGDPFGRDIVINSWRGPSGDGFVQAFNCTDDSIVALSTAFEYDAADGDDASLAQIDNTHYIQFYVGSSSDGKALVLAIDYGTGAVSAPGATLSFDTGNVFGAPSVVAVGDGTHFVTVWSNGSGVGLGGQAQTFSVNTGTWAITAIGSPLNWDSLGGDVSAYAVGDGSHFIVLYQAGASGHFSSRCLVMNTGTFAITTVGSVADLGFSGNDLVGAALDGYHIVAFYSRNVGFGYVQMLELNPSTFDMSLVGETLDGYDFANGGYTAAINLESNQVMVVWGNVDQLAGQAAMFQTFGDPVEGKWLYAASGDEVFNTAPGDGGVWVSRRSGLAEVSKPRFVQYLNYIWMVNGNEFEGGDPVATSNGGDFGTDLVPEDFPRGDFISAGFEGRVWVANKTLGTIYYTDIVQFVPPATYVLTYNAAVNFISTLAPQTGQNFTGLFEVPRALLVFTEDTITRIYGASSVDAYPAYNVGTYSQESIVQTKTGIFFHHSSGFYQFDYGSQPVEISRRIIDFVQAIPRANYDDILGIWDGFDCVKWYVGQVVVEGVVFRNCMVRYTISTQVWTIYDYKGIDITALIGYDDGSALNQVVGAVVTADPDDLNKTGTLDTGLDDFGQPFYYEFIDRWRPYTNMYYLTKSISGLSVYSENAAGANLLYQKQKSGPNAWQPIGTVTEANNAVMPNSSTDDFDVIRWRLVGTTKGAKVVVHGIEITQLTIKGQETN